MNLLHKSLITLAATSALLSTPLEAKYVFRNGSLVDKEFAPTMSYLDHYSAACQAYEAQKWEAAHRHFYIVAHSFSNCPLASEAYFYLGVCYFHLEEYDIANAALDDYLASSNNPLFFELAFNYKFAIAEKFRCGSKRRYCGSRKLPKWACGRDLASSIYDEIVISLPSHDLAVRSLYAKGWLLWEDRDFKGAIDAFQGVVRRFPKNELTPDCYLLINHVYLEQALYEFQNPDLLAFAEINQQRFARAFPKEERLSEGEDLVMCIKEVYAKGLYDIGFFYEKKEKPNAASLYYQITVIRFPETGYAQLAIDRLTCLRPGWYESYQARVAEATEAEKNQLKGKLPSPMTAPPHGVIDLDDLIDLES